MLEIVNLTKTKIDTDFLQKAAQAAFAVFPKNDRDISLVFVGDAKMKALNNKYRNKNKTTDVLSFEDLDEIFICLPQAKKQALPSHKASARRGKLLKTPLNLELMRLLVHGIVHLNGYDHEKSARDAKRMFAVEDKILKNL